MQGYSGQLSTVNPLSAFHDIIESWGKKADVVSLSVRSLEEHNKVEN